MNTLTKLSASRLIVMTLACLMAVCLTACGGDDDEPTVDELLSEETTPIDFVLQDFGYHDKYFLFDYAGGRYVGSDTITKSECKLNLRQGKHHLIWMKAQYGGNVGFNPENKMFATYDNSVGKTAIDVAYSEMDMEITPYLMPVKAVVCDKHFTVIASQLVIEVSDMDRWDDLHIKPIDEYAELKVVGFPTVKSISWYGNGYEIEDRYDGIYTNIYDDTIELSTICPTSGLDNIQVNVELWNTNGNKIPTTKLPTFSMRRKFTTVLRGPLFSGNTRDWTVEMIPSKE